MHVFCGVTIKKVLARSPACSGVVPETVRIWMMAVHGLWVADPGLPVSGFLFWLRSFLFLFPPLSCCLLLLLFVCFVAAFVPAVLCGSSLLLACCSPCLLSFSFCPGSVTCGPGSGLTSYSVGMIGYIATALVTCMGIRVPSTNQPTNQPTTL